MHACLQDCSQLDLQTVYSRLRRLPEYPVRFRGSYTDGGCDNWDDPMYWVSCVPCLVYAILNINIPCCVQCCAILDVFNAAGHGCIGHAVNVVCIALAIIQLGLLLTDTDLDIHQTAEGCLLCCFSHASAFAAVFDVSKHQHSPVPKCMLILYGCLLA